MIDKKLFREVNASVKGSDVLQMLGVECKNGFFLCPEPGHSDNHPSCKIYDDGYFCHVCHGHGDNIHLVALTEGISDTEALKRINSYFGLGFDVEKSTTGKTSSVPKENPRKVFREWVRNSTDVLCWWCRALGQIIIKEDASRFRDICELQRDFLETVLDEFACHTPEESYQRYKGVVNDYYELSRQYRRLWGAGQRDKTECIRELLGCTEAICWESEEDIPSVVLA